MYNVEIDVMPEAELKLWRSMATYGIAVLNYTEEGCNGMPTLIIGHKDNLYLKAFVLREYDNQYEYDDLVEYIEA